MKRRASGPLLFSIATHVVLAIVILNAAFHYNFEFTGPRPIPPVQEQVTYVAVSPAGGAVGGNTHGAPARATVPSRGLLAPLNIPTAVTTPTQAVGGTPGGVQGGLGVGGGIGPTTGIVPADPDPRLARDAHAFFPVPKTHAQRVDSAVKATILAYNDSVARAAGNAGRAPGDWTFEKGGKKWGIDGSKIYLGKFAIPSAVLAALPIKIGSNPGEGNVDRLAPSRRSDVMLHADSREHAEEFKESVKRIRERKDRERRESRGESDASD